MIKRLIIRDFRSNKQQNIKFDPHITTICGESFRGKSNILRALKWVMLNRPTGTSLIRWGAKSCEVIITTKKHKIKRKRSKSKNTYEVDGNVLKAFGNKIPDSVSKILNISDINFQRQQDPTFWFTLTPGEVSRQLNKIVNLDIIDRTLSNLQSGLSRAKSVVEVTKNRLTESRKKRSELSFVKQMSKEWKDVRKILSQYDELEISYVRLEELLSGIRKQKKRLKKLKRIGESCNREIAELEHLHKEAFQYNERYVELISLIRNIRYRQVYKTQVEKELQKAKSKYDKMMKGRCPLCGRK